MRRGQATIELLVVLALVLGLAAGIARLAGREIVRGQGEHALARGLEARAEGTAPVDRAVLAALPVALRRASVVVVGPAAVTLTIDPPGPIGAIRFSAPLPAP
jgi:type II secretory pathway pseudopilin PulG